MVNKLCIRAHCSAVLWLGSSRDTLPPAALGLHKAAVTQPLVDGKAVSNLIVVVAV